MMTSYPSGCTAAIFSPVELEVAEVLSNLLPSFVLESDHRPALGNLRWGARRRRFLTPDQTPPPPPPPPSPPPPPPSVSPPLEEEHNKDGSTPHGGNPTAGTSSPATPLSFPPSGSEEPDLRPPRPPPKLTAKRHKEWVKDHQDLVVSLSDQKANLLRQIEEYRSNRERLRAINSFLKQQRSKSGVEPGGGRWGPSVELRIGPSAVDRTSGRVEFDLNSSPEEEEEEEEEEDPVWDWEQQSAYKAAMSAQARKRRLEIQREKSAAAGSLFHSHKFPSTAHKMPRLTSTSSSR
ncbi:uncharacterized protein [Typha angustifolia]|uniref:uncharacterized protein n=1 Tax=Typha angustifolia TaxID=59011 RepID=UPI003C2AD0B1